MGRDSVLSPATLFIAGELDRHYRESGRTLDQLAADSGVARSTVHRMLKGSTPIAVDTLLPLCEALRVDVGDLMRRAADAR